MVALILAARWPVVAYLGVAILALVIIVAILAGQAIDDVGSWRWSSGRPV